MSGETASEPSLPETPDRDEILWAVRLHIEVLRDLELEADWGITAG